MATLKKVWVLAICRAGSAEVSPTRLVSGAMKGKTSATPSTLNAMWATATRRASEDERMLAASAVAQVRSEEHTSELQSHLNLVCRLLLEKKKQHTLNPLRPPLSP